MVEGRGRPRLRIHDRRTVVVLGATGATLLQACPAAFTCMTPTAALPGAATGSRCVSGCVLPAAATAGIPAPRPGGGDHPRWPTSTSACIERHRTLHRQSKGRLLAHWDAHRGRFVKVFRTNTPCWPNSRCRSKEGPCIMEQGTPLDSQVLNLRRRGALRTGRKAPDGTTGSSSAPVLNCLRRARAAWTAASVLWQTTAARSTTSFPDWNDLRYRGEWRQAYRSAAPDQQLPEFTSRIRPAPCEAACTLNINDDAVGIIHRAAIIDKAPSEG